MVLRCDRELLRGLFLLKGMTFEELNLNKPLLNALKDMGISEPTPIQEKVFSVVMSGRDVCAIAQTGTGKTLAYLLPCLRQHQYSKEQSPQLLILVPTRELAVQVAEVVEQLSVYMSLRVVGVYGGSNMKPQMAELAKGADVLVGTPGRVNDLLSSGAFKPKTIRKVIIDEFDEMLNLGFRTQLKDIFDKIPHKRQNLLFSATLTDEVSELLDNFFNNPVRIEAAVAGSPVAGIAQSYYEVPNFYTKVNFLELLLTNNDEMSRVLVFVSTKRLADLLYERLREQYEDRVEVIHSNKAQNHRFASVNSFQNGYSRVLIATDVLARGLDVEDVTHVINFDLPESPESYVHRIGRTGRKEKKGDAISFVNEQDKEHLHAIEALMNYKIQKLETPRFLDVSEELLEEEKPVVKMKTILIKPPRPENPGSAFQEKSEKNRKINVRRNIEEEKKKKYGKAYEKRRKDK